MKIAMLMIVGSSFSMLWGGAAQSTPGKAETVFSCSLGAKHVGVTRNDGRLLYQYGPQGRAEISISENGGSRNVAYHEELYPHGAQTSLRFRNGAYSYVVFNRWASADYQGKGAEDLSGLVVLKDDRVLSRMTCKAGGDFNRETDLSSLPKDPNPRAIFP